MIVYLNVEKTNDSKLLYRKIKYNPTITKVFNIPWFRLHIHENPFAITTEIVDE